ncbi:MAG: LysR family transcriptional regulator [Kofleriaceae bacterium]|nr:LysR family transcriptional regulator [Kofleriaceae bacterium]
MRIDQLDLNLLVVLRTVLAERSVVRAAQLLHVTPSAISNSLARLRDALGDPLVVKSGRGIVPTPRAAAMAPLLEATLHELDRAVHGETFDPATAARQFTLAIADAGQLIQVPRLAAEIGTQMPHARLRVVGIDTLLASGGLAGTEVDLAIAAINASPGIHARPLYAEHTLLVARKGHPRGKAPLTKHQLSGLRHVDVQIAPGRGYKDLAAAYSRLGIERQVAITVPTFVAAAAMVAATDFVATLPASFVERHGSGFGIRKLGGVAPRLTVPINMAWHARTDADPAMRFFRQLVKVAVLSPT